MLTGKKLCPLGLWIGTAALLSGCVARQISLAGPGRPPAVKTSTYASADYKQDVKEYEVNLEGEDDPVTARHLRDKIAYGLMSDIDEAYGQFTDHLYAGKGVIAVSGDSMVLGLTAASTIATHTPTKTILSALGTAVTGVDLSFDKNFFAQQTFQSIAIAMQTRRDKARQEALGAAKAPEVRT